MESNVGSYVTLVEILEVLGPFDDVAAQVAVVLKRLEAEGVPGLASMQFYADKSKNELGAIITFRDPADMIAHTKMISGWDDFKRFASMTRLKDMRIHGVITPEVEAWVRQFDGPLAKYESFVAGFVR